MSDARLRELERGDDAGDVAARVRLITERLRVGAITSEQVRLAAFVGDAAARFIAGSAAEPDIRGLNQWWSALVAQGAHVATRSFCAASSLAVVPEHETRLRSVMDWCVCPCRVHALIVENGGFDGREDAPGALLSRHLIASAALAARGRVGPGRPRRVHSTAQRLTQQGITTARTRAAIQAALVPWLLGDDDPLLCDRAHELTGPWACAFLGLQGPLHDELALETLHLTEDPTPALRLLDAVWAARLPAWPVRTPWSVSTPRYGPGGVSLESAPRVGIMRSFARWSAFVSDPELRHAHLPGITALARLIGATAIAWAPDDADLAAAAREGADLDSLVARLTTRRGPPAASRLDADSLPEGAESWWHVSTLT